MHIRSLLLANCAMLAVSGICFAPTAEGSGAAPAEATNGEAQRQLTFGEKRVGITFNPSNSGDVDNVKRRAADLIDALNGSSSASDDGEAKRCFALAMTAIEDGAMWGVKGLTKPKG